LHVFSISTVETFHGNTLAWRTITGTPTKPLLTFQPTGKTITVSGLSAVVLQKGKVVQHWELSDDAQLQAPLEASLGKG
jgi:hypothetical protein